MEDGGRIEAADGRNDRGQTDGESGGRPQGAVDAQVEVADRRTGGGRVVRPLREPEVGANREGLGEDADEEDPDDGGDAHGLEVECIDLAERGGREVLTNNLLHK